MEMHFCQSCGMPVDDATLGTEADGRQSADFCHYCYQAGQFTSDVTMDEMIEFCVPHMVQGNPGMTEEKARAAMQGFFPMLKRWGKH